jgi:hypothetical protein
MLNSLIGIIASSGGGVANSYESIATVTVGSGGSSSVTFSSIPSTYQHLQIRGITKSTASSQDFLYLRVNSDTGTNYSSHRIQGDGASATASGFATQDQCWFGFAAGTSNTNIFGATVLDILDYANTNKNKTMRGLHGVDYNGSGIVYGPFSNAWYSTSAITSITIYGASNIGQYSSFALYGIKG